MMQYDYTSAPPGMAPPVLPQLDFPVKAGAPVALMFIHPKCPCTRASLAQFAALLAALPEPISAHILVYNPESESAAWVEGENWTTAAAIPQAQVTRDWDGKRARRFAALTSGATVVYNAQGQLIFAGGLTASRGQYGESSAHDFLVGAMHNKAAAFRHMPVFGCAILDADTKQAR